MANSIGNLDGGSSSSSRCLCGREVSTLEQGEMHTCPCSRRLVRTRGGIWIGAIDVDTLVARMDGIERRLAQLELFHVIEKAFPELDSK